MINTADMSEQKDALYERGPGIFEPDTLLASQYFDRLRRRGGHSGERALMVAILEDAVTVYLKHATAAGPHERRLFEEAEQWIEDHDPTYVCSFDNICDLLGLEADYLRNGLRAAKERARRGRVGTVTIRVDDRGGTRRASGG